MEMNVKIAIGMPTNRGVKPQTALSLLEMVAKSEYKFHPIISTEGYNTAENRNRIVAQAIKNNCTHLLLTDDDMTYDSDTLDRLVAHKKDIVGATANVRGMHPDGVETLVVEYLKDEIDFGDVFKVKAIGGSMLLIDLSIIPKIETPLFWYKVHKIGMVEMSNDYWFCEKAREAGFDIWYDSTIKLKHIGDREY